MGPVINGSLIQNLLHSPSHRMGESIELAPGQILKGRVLENLPGDQALLQLGKVKVISQLEVPLNAGEKGWFQVQSNQERVLLKMLSREHTLGLSRSSQSIDSFASLASSLGLEDTTENKQLLEQIVKEQIPMTKGQFQQLKDLIHELGKDHKLSEAIVLALKRQIPLTREVIQSLSTFLGRSGATNLMEELKRDITELLQKSYADSQPLLEKLYMKLERLLQNGADRIQSGQELAKWYQELGVEWEKQLGTERLQDGVSLKSLLLQMREGFGLDSAGKLLQFITGQQLFITPTDTAFQQFIFHIPFFTQALSFVQLEGKKKQTGELDPDNCRLLFYLQLPELGNILLDVKIINRIVAIEFHAEEAKLTSYLQGFKQELQESLQEHGYHLSSVKLLEPQVHVPNSNLFPEKLAVPYKGVDIRI
ncbi:hypothetical protein [Ammoniphilus sp. CFH 90114]|uniref:hypothetical protein n=1 Tax=Ammoniphilus sp. CFH 90114 TaxID=2493665 RepID=UPI00100F9FE5|nr:hypothetical protein [Ammoniphilus sp. CFH 90114]RXT15096.1 hypothetical protein EIZ39_02490 [Ammoniphilus sp. CFH 90114]